MSLIVGRDYVVGLASEREYLTLRVVGCHHLDVFGCYWKLVCCSRIQLSCNPSSIYSHQHFEICISMNVFSGHEGPVLCGAFSRDGKHILTGGDEGSLRVWNPKTAACVLAIKPSPMFHEGVYGCGSGRLRSRYAVKS